MELELLIPLIWLFITILFIVIEVMTFNLLTIWFAIGSSSAMFVSIADYDNYPLQVIVFIVVSAVSLIIIRNWSLKKLKAGAIKTNVNSLIGKTAIVTKQVEPFQVGEVKVDGNYWSAKAQNEIVIEEGTLVEILEVNGVKLIVKIK